MSTIHHTILATLLLFQLNAFSQDLIQVRSLFYRSVKSAQSADSLFLLLQKTTDKSRAELQGYKAMSSFMVCLHSYNPYTKFNYFLEGKKQLQQAIENYPQNLELRFLRYTTQLNTPSFLGYNSHMQEDKEFILNKAKLITDTDFFNRLYNYAQTAKKLNAEEKKALQQALLSNKLATTFN